jgi:hypothetical protein
MRPRLAILAVTALAALGTLALIAGRRGDGGEEGVARAPASGASPSGEPAEREPARRRSPAEAALLAAAPRRVAAPRGRAPKATRGLIAKVRAGARLAVRDRPGGRVLGRVGHRTDFGSRTALAVFATRDGGRWIGVATSLRRPGRLGWIRVRAGALDWYRTDRSAHVDLSERRLELRAGDRVLERATVGIGRPSTPTPTGRFGVTDRLRGSDFGWWYGCCIIALTGVQPDLPPGWQGGNRIAIHGTPAEASIGAAASAGCVRGSNELLRRLMVELPLGAPVHIRA